MAFAARARDRVVGDRRVDHLRLMMQESRELADFLARLGDPEWEVPSLCTGWRVREVVSHMAVGHRMPIGRYGFELARRRFRMDATAFELARDFSLRHSPAQILDAFRAGTAGPPRAAARLVPLRDLFVDHLVHHQDIRRPLGLSREIPPARLLAALESLALMRTVPCRRRMAGLHFIATDVDFARRDGDPQVRGTAEAIIMAVAGRVAALPELSGDGVDTLAGRVGAARRPPRIDRCGRATRRATRRPFRALLAGSHRDRPEGL